MTAVRPSRTRQARMAQSPATETTAVNTGDATTKNLSDQSNQVGQGWVGPMSINYTIGCRTGARELAEWADWYVPSGLEGEAPGTLRRWWFRIAALREARGL